LIVLWLSPSSIVVGVGVGWLFVVWFWRCCFGSAEEVILAEGEIPGKIRTISTKRYLS
jgi:hypothetical protein